MKISTRILAGLLAACSWYAVAAQCYWAGTPAGIFNVLSYFTIWTNILAASVLTTVAAGAGDQARRFPTISQQTAVASYVVIVGIVYELLLRRLWNPTGWRFVSDMILHNVMPIGYLLYWVVAVPKGQLRYAYVWRWTIYPVIYLGFCVLRGHTGGFFPYPFANFTELGYGRFAWNVLGLIGVFVGTGFGFITLDRLLARRGIRTVTPSATESYPIRRPML